MEITWHIDSTEILLLWLLIAHFVFGMGERLYDKRWWFAPSIHILGGLFLGSLTGSIFLSAVIAIWWEAFEYLFDQVAPRKISDWTCWHSRDSYGAARDILFSILGATIFIWITQL